MKTLFIVLSFVVMAAPSFAQNKIAHQGIMEGEPDPNSGPASREEVITLDDTKCPKGKKPFLKMSCGMPEAAKPTCEKHSPVIECLKKKKNLRCKKPKIPVPVFTCDQ